MLLWRERLLDVPIMSLQTGTQLGVIKESIINPKDLSIIAFYCEGPLIQEKPAVLHTADIREFGELGMIIDDSDMIMPLEGLVRLQQILDYNFELIDKRVIDTTKSKLGKITNYIIETNSFEIVKLGVRRPFLKALNDAELLIDRDQIRKITDTEIIVEAPTVKEKTPVLRETLRPAQEFRNPFRGAQPEHIDNQK